MSIRDVVLIILGIALAIFVVLMTYITILGVMGRGIMASLMHRTDGVMFFVMAAFPIFGVLLVLILAIWLSKREGGL